MDWKMNRKEWTIFNHDKKLFNQLEQNRYKCKCGHSITITSKYDRAFCDWCKHWFYKDPEKQKEYEKKLDKEKKVIKKINFKKELMKRL